MRYDFMILDVFTDRAFGGNQLAVLPDGGTSFSPEFEACRRVATEKNLPLKDVYEAAQRTFHST